MEHQAGLDAKELWRKHGVSDATANKRARSLAAWKCRMPRS